MNDPRHRSRTSAYCSVRAARILRGVALAAWLTGLDLAHPANAAPAQPTADRVDGPCRQDTVRALTAALRTRWKLIDGDLQLRCFGGTFGAPGWYLRTSVRSSTGSSVRSGVVSLDGSSDLAAFTVDSAPAFESVVDVRVADLDGDGVDEIIETWRRAAHGAMGSDNWLVVRPLDGHSLRRIAGPHLSVFLPGLGSCNASWRMVKAGKKDRLVIAVSLGSPTPPSECLAPGRHTFELRAGRLVEIAAPVH